MTKEQLGELAVKIKDLQEEFTSLESALTAKNEELLQARALMVEAMAEYTVGKLEAEGVEDEAVLAHAGKKIG